MNIFELNKSKQGQIFTIRPLLNPKNIKNSILTYVVDYRLDPISLQRGWIYRHLCFALIDGELNILDYPNILSKNINDESLKMNSDKYFRIGVYYDYDDLYYKCDTFRNDGLRFDNTQEKRDYITDILKNTSLNLFESLKYQKNKYKDVVVDILDPNDFEKTIKRKLSDFSQQEMYLDM